MLPSFRSYSHYLFLTSSKYFLRIGKPLPVVHSWMTTEVLDSGYSLTRDYILYMLECFVQG